MNMLSNGSNPPIHMTVAKDIRESILEGRLKPGQKIMSEHELCRQYEVSRGTVRQALNTLVKEGLLLRRQGKGTFVREIPERASFKGKGALNIGVFVDIPPRMQGSGFIMELIQGLRQAAEGTHPKCNLQFEFHSIDSEADLVGILHDRKRHLDGVVVVPMGDTFSGLVEGASFGSMLPTVLFHRQVENKHFSNFYINQEEGAFRATDYLLCHGHRKICILLVSPIAARPDSHARFDGYRRALTAHDVAFDEALVVEVSLSLGSIQQALEEAYAGSNPPTALLIGGLALHTPVLRVLNQLDLRQPEDVSVVAFDDSEEAAMHEPALTVVRQPFVRGTHLALERLIADIMQSGNGPISVALNPELLIRDSVRTISSMAPSSAARGTAASLD